MAAVVLGNSLTAAIVHAPRAHAPPSMCQNDLVNRSRAFTGGMACLCKRFQVRVVLPASSYGALCPGARRAPRCTVANPAGAFPKYVFA